MVLVGKVTFVGDDDILYDDADAFLDCIREELPYRDTPSRRWAAMWRAVCSTTSTCPCCGAGMAKRRTTLCWWAVCSLSDNEK